ncbi:MAG: L-threonylcarbamoyladenylate synthase, partial [Limisphaerales bacterium]
FIQALIRECDFPLAAPSANPSNRVSPTNAEHVRRALGNRVRLIVDGGQSQVGIESTVLDLSVSPPRVLRPGMIHEQALVSVTGTLVRTAEHESEVLKSPGLLRKHYAPRARLVLCSWANDQALRKFTSEIGVPDTATCVIAHTRIPAPGNFASVSVIPHDAEAFARAIYAELHRCDEAGAELIVMEALPGTAEWQAIADRLARAAA